MLSKEEQYLFNLSAISHEIRNPVAIINSYLQLTQRKHPEVQSFDTWAPLMENMDFLKKLLQDLSAYTNAGKINKQLCSLTDIIEHVLVSSQPAALPIIITFEKPDTVPLTYLDQGRIRCALMNLIRNSYESIKNKDSGRIQLSLLCQNDNFILSVSDNGEKIPEEHLPTLFQPFITYKSDGTGLGLALVYEIISAHNGQISVCSTEEETCFKIILPMDREIQNP